MLLRDIIAKNDYGTWIFYYNEKMGVLFFNSLGENVHIHYGYDKNKEFPECYGDYKNLTEAINKFSIDGIPLMDLLDTISCEMFNAGN